MKLTALLHSLSRLRMGGSTPLVPFCVQLYLSLKPCLNNKQVKCIYSNNNVNNSTKMGKQKYIEKFSILCILAYQSLLQYSNQMHIIYLIHIFFTKSLLHVFVCYKPSSYYLLKTICFLQGCYTGCEGAG